MLSGLLATAGAVHAGSPDGLNIAVIASDTALPYSSSVKQFLSDYKTDGVKCGRHALRMENVYLANLPRRLSSELALAAIHDKAKRKKLGKILTDFRDETLENGFDAALVYGVKGSQLRFYGVSGDASEAIVVSSLPLDEAKDQKKFNIAACKAASSLPNLPPLEGALRAFAIKRQARGHLAFHLPP